MPIEDLSPEPEPKPRRSGKTKPPANAGKRVAAKEPAQTAEPLHPAREEFLGEILKQRPGLTREEAIEMLRAFGG